MKLTPRKARFLINAYPPLFFNRIVVQRISDDFCEIDVKIKHSWLNKNLQKTIFGGTLFSAADPFYSLMYWQNFAQLGIKTEAWVKRLEIDYKRPAKTDVYLHFKITPEEQAEALQAIQKEGVFQRWHQVNIVDTEGKVCCIVKIWVYLKHKKTASNLPQIN